MFLSSIGRLAQSVGGGLMTAAQGAADAVMNPIDTVGEAIMGSQAVSAVQDPAKYFDDEVTKILNKIRAGGPLTSNEMAMMKAFQQQAQQNFQNAQAAVQIPTGGFMNSAQQRLM